MIQARGPKVATLQSALNARLSQHGQPTIAVDGVRGPGTNNALAWIGGPRFREAADADEVLARIRAYNGDPAMASLPHPRDVLAVQTKLRLTKDGDLGPETWNALDHRFPGVPWHRTPFGFVRDAVLAGRPLSSPKMPATVAVLDPGAVLVEPPFRFDRQSGLPQTQTEPPLVGPGGVQRPAVIGPGGKPKPPDVLKVWMTAQKPAPPPKKPVQGPGTSITTPKDKPKATFTQEAALGPAPGSATAPGMTGWRKWLPWAAGALGIGMLVQAYNRD